ncbi:hypothetical protein E2C01_053718 [Portunus trituberculatus]|uniref:Uncharacterized protein n=1 Tax=Portunus trituberculatus TaxID=210409 RepID=A0A5B7GL37_PORTR|nr:hypothetical protein [Portunus trituberculatus]
MTIKNPCSRNYGLQKMEVMWPLFSKATEMTWCVPKSVFGDDNVEIMLICH